MKLDHLFSQNISNDWMKNLDLDRDNVKNVANLSGVKTQKSNKIKNAKTHINNAMIKWLQQDKGDQLKKDQKEDKRHAKYLQEAKRYVRFLKQVQDLNQSEKETFKQSFTKYSIFYLRKIYPSILFNSKRGSNKDKRGYWKVHKDLINQKIKELISKTKTRSPIEMQQQDQDQNSNKAPIERLQQDQGQNNNKAPIEMWQQDQGQNNNRAPIEMQQQDQGQNGSQEPRIYQSQSHTYDQ